MEQHLKELYRNLKKEYSIFNMAEDQDEVEATIYRIKALEIDIKRFLQGAKHDYYKDRELAY
jgi:hypothetical protein